MLVNLGRLKCSLFYTFDICKTFIYINTECPHSIMASIVTVIKLISPDITNKIIVEAAKVGTRTYLDSKQTNFDFA